MVNLDSYGAATVKSLQYNVIETDISAFNKNPIRINTIKKLKYDKKCNL